MEVKQTPANGNGLRGSLTDIERSELAKCANRHSQRHPRYGYIVAGANVRGLHPASAHLPLSLILLEDRSFARPPPLLLRNPDKWYAGWYHLSVLVFVVFAVSQSRRVTRYVSRPAPRGKKNMMYSRRCRCCRHETRF